MSQELNMGSIKTSQQRDFLITTLELKIFSKQNQSKNPIKRMLTDSPMGHDSYNVFK